MISTGYGRGRSDRVLATALTVLVRAYQLALRPLIGNNCRFVPGCSDYAIEALSLHGAWRGTWLAGRRILRCNPWVASGYDPVPPCGCSPATGVAQRRKGLCFRPESLEGRSGGSFRRWARRCQIAMSRHRGGGPSFPAPKIRCDPVGRPSATRLPGRTP